MGRQVKLVLVDDLEEGTAKEVAGQVSSCLELEVVLSKGARCEGGFDPSRKQWLAEWMVERCVRSYASSDCYAVGLTERDLYTPGLNFVFGLALREAGAAIVSWHRLGGEGRSFSTRIIKEVVHEVGHLEGLDHCPKENCVMWFSNTLWETDRKTADFCGECRMRRRAISLLGS